MLAGIVSVYCSSIEKSELQMVGARLEEYSRDRKDLLGFEYDEEDMIDIIKIALEF